MKIGFDHCFQRIRRADDYFGLSKRGFTIEDHTVEHPGKQFCRFLRFNKPASLCGGMNFHYLEFAEVPDIEALKTTFDHEVSDREAMEPGFSLSCDENLRELFEKARTTFSDSAPKFEHKNYAWKTDDKSNLPGWNFLMFGRHVVDDTYVWCTEYEPHPDRKNSPMTFSHPNTANRFHGFVWNLPLSRLAQFQLLAGTEVVNGALRLQDDLMIYSRDAAEVPDALWKKSKDYPFAAVILLCEDWPKFLHEGKPDLHLKWNGRNTGLIRMPAGGWDILVMEDSGPS